MKYVFGILAFLLVPLSFAMELPEKGTKKEESEQQLIKPTTFASYNEKLQKTLLLDWNKKLFEQNDALYRTFIQQYGISKHFYKARLKTQELSRFLYGIVGTMSGTVSWASYLIKIHDQLLKIRKDIGKGIAQLKQKKEHSQEAIDLLRAVNYVIACVKAAIGQEQDQPPSQEKKMRGKKG